MSVKITGIDDNSPAEKSGIAVGMSLVSVNGHEINDVLDYGFYTADRHLNVILEAADGSRFSVVVNKSEYEQLGIEAESFLMDKQHRCSNNCVFCFIDQLPKGMRESLYFKDDDERLSYLFGNYITLTNMGDAEIERIIAMKIEPINISVHTTNPELRCRMMGNRFAGEKLKYLYRLADAGIPINCQIVLCRDMNDGDELRRTLSDLITIAPPIQSIACVPVGVTGYREGLPELKTFDHDSACEVIDIIEESNSEYLKKFNKRIAFPSDEFFLLAGRDIPPIEYYEELLQIENGVGMLAQLCDEFEATFCRCERAAEHKPTAFITGEAAAPTIKMLANRAKQIMPDISYEVFAIHNDFFGGCVSVSGLVTATDIIKQMKGKLNGFTRAVIPRDMLRREGDVFLDDLTPDDVERELGVELAISSDGCDLADILAGC